MNQEQLVYLKIYFHTAPPIWSSHSREVAEGNNGNTDYSYFKFTRTLNSQVDETSYYLKHKMVAICIWW